MNREIKFRAYIKPDPEFGEPGKMVFPVWTGLPIDDNHEFQWEDERGNRNDYGCDDAEWMQYTGFKDKNGKEVYDCDFLKYENDLYLIRWNDEFMGFMFDKKGWMFSHRPKEMPEINEMEVIGNIYENADLITS